MMELLRIKFVDESGNLLIVTVDKGIPKEAETLDMIEADTIPAPTDEVLAEMEAVVEDLIPLIEAESDKADYEFEDGLLRRIYEDIAYEVSDKLYADLLLGGTFEDIQYKFTDDEYEHWCLEWNKVLDEYKYKLELLKNYMDVKAYDVYQRLDMFYYGFLKPHAECAFER